MKKSETLPVLEIFTFGGLSLRWEQETITSLGSRKAEALLVYLAVTGRSIPRDVLAELFWPEREPKRAQGNLRRVLYDLRRHLEPYLTIDRDVIAIRPDLVQVDVTQLQNQLAVVDQQGGLVSSDMVTALETAVSLYKGLFLHGFPTGDSRDFESWLWGLQEQLEQQVMAALQQLVSWYLAYGPYERGLPHAGRLLQLDPYRESSLRQLMRLLAYNEQTAEALAQYERTRQLLWDEMGMAPMEKTTALCEQIRVGDVAAVVVSETAVRGYDIQEEIGAGAFGVVHRARQPHVNRDVAVKIIAPKLANEPDFIRRFEVEAQMVARLEHPHIVPLYDYWREPDGAYLVMRYLRGGSLEQLLGEGQLSIEKAGRILEQVCAALGAAHQQSIVHRDIKPANILLDEADNAYLSDFGFAKELGVGRQLTADGALVGTPDYISPEQFSDEPISPVSDMYSLGIVLFQMLTGQVPFPGLSLNELIYKHLHEPIPSAHSLRPELSPAVDEVIWQATAKAPHDRFQNTLALAAAFDEAVQGRRVVGEVVIVPDKEIANPYKGLRPFQEVDSDDFYGRDALVEKLLSRLAPSVSPSVSFNGSESMGTDRFLAVVGPSGSGKSSAVKAGLIPALRRGDIPGSEKWFVVEMVPGTHPLEELEVALLRVAVEPPPSLLEPLQKDERGLIRTLKRVLPPPDGNERPQLLLIIDQFEELFTLVEDVERRRHFIASLITALEDSRSQLRVIITLRADFYDRPLQHPVLGEYLQQRTEVVLPLSLAELEQAIIRPAAQMGVRLEPDLAARIAADVADQPGALPLLQYMLTELFERRQGWMMTTAAYRGMGGVLGALGRRADEIYEGLEPAEKIVTRHLFLRLVTLGEGVEDTRRRVLQAELSQLETPGVYEAEPLVEKVMAVFGRYRLLTFDHDPVTRGPTVEVAHEALLREWEKLRGWLATSRDDIRMQRRLAQASNEWLEHERESGFLLRGSRLDQFAGWASETPLALTGEERAFLEASLAGRKERLAEEEARRQRELETARQLAETERQRAEEQQRRAEEQTRASGRFRRLAAGLAVVFMFAVGAAFFAAVQRGEALDSADVAATAAADALDSADVAATAAADAQNQQAVAEQERTLADENADLALSRELAAVALNVLDTDPELGIRLALEALSITHTLQAENALHRTIIAAPEIFYFADSAETHDIVTFSPDGTSLATGGEDTEAIIWDVATGTKSQSLSGHTDLITDIVYSPNGLKILTSSLDGTAKVWDSLTGEDLITLSHNTLINSNSRIVTNVMSVAISQDGNIIGTADNLGRILLWGADSGDVLRKLEGPPTIIFDLDFSPDGTMLVSAGSDGFARLWDIQTGEEKGTFFHGTNGLKSATFSPVGTHLATVDQGANMKMWDLGTLGLAGQNQPLFTVNSWMGRVKFINNGADLVTFNSDNRLHIQDANTGSELRIFGCSSRDGFWFDVNSDGTKAAVIGLDGRVSVCNLSDSEELKTLSGHSGALYGAIFNPEGTIIYSADDMGVWNAWNVEKPGASSFDQIIISGEIQEDQFLDIEISPDGRQLATASINGVPRIWDTANGEISFTLSGHLDRVNRVAFSPDGSTLASASFDHSVMVWDAKTGDLRTKLSTPGIVWDISFSPDGAYLAAGYDNGIIVWEVVGQRVYLSRSAKLTDSRILAVTFSPDGKYLVSGDEKGTIQIWDFGSLLANRNETEAFFILAGHTNSVESVNFSPNGNYLTSASADNTIRVWNLNTGQQELLLTGHTDGVMDVAFSPDGNWLASASLDGTVRVYVLNLEELIELGYSRLTRWWTAEECRQYLHTDTCPEAPPGLEF